MEFSNWIYFVYLVKYICWGSSWVHIWTDLFSVWLCIHWSRRSQLPVRYEFTICHLGLHMALSLPCLGAWSSPLKPRYAKITFARPPSAIGTNPRRSRYLILLGSSWLHCNKYNLPLLLCILIVHAWIRIILTPSPLFPTAGIGNVTTDRVFSSPQGFEMSRKKCR